MDTICITNGALDVEIGDRTHRFLSFGMPIERGNAGGSMRFDVRYVDEKEGASLPHDRFEVALTRRERKENSLSATRLLAAYDRHRDEVARMEEARAYA